MAVATAKKAKTTTTEKRLAPKLVWESGQAGRLAHNNGVKIMLIPADRLFVDHDYQRKGGKAKINRIASRFDWGAVSLPTVSPRRDETFAIVDGQNRFEAMKRAFPGLKDAKGQPIDLLCVVLDCKTRKKEADHWGRINANQTSPSPNEKFKADLFKGDKGCKAVYDILNQHGITISLGAAGEGPRQLEDNQTIHGGILYRAYLALGEGKFKFMIALVAGFKREDEYIESKALQGMFLVGLSRFLERSDRSRSEIRKGLARGKSATAIVDAAQRQIGSAGRWERANVVAKQVEAAIKFGLKNETLEF